MTHIQRIPWNAPKGLWGMIFWHLHFSKMSQNRRLSVSVLFGSRAFSQNVPLSLYSQVKLYARNPRNVHFSHLILEMGHFYDFERMQHSQKGAFWEKTRNQISNRKLTIIESFDIYGHFQKLRTKFCHKILPDMLFGSLPGAIP